MVFFFHTTISLISLYHIYGIPYQNFHPMSETYQRFLPPVLKSVPNSTKASV